MPTAFASSTFLVVSSWFGTKSAPPFLQVLFPEDMLVFFSLLAVHVVALHDLIVVFNDHAVEVYGEAAFDE